MDGQSPEFALTRIDAALARIEAAAARPRAAADTDASELARRHTHLRAAVVETLRELDGLIGGQ